MTKPLSFTQASLKRAILAAQACGLRVAGIGPDGTLLLDNAPGTLARAALATHSGNEPVPSPAADVWGDVEA